MTFVHFPDTKRSEQRFATRWGWFAPNSSNYQKEFFLLKIGAHSANGQPLNFWGFHIYIIGKIKLKLLFHDPLAE